MNAQGLFGDEDLQLIELLQEHPLELSDEASAPSTTKSRAVMMMTWSR